MKHLFQIFICLFSIIAFSQNVTVDSQTYTPQQLIEDILIDSDCIENVVVTNVIGGNFENTDQSYGYFDATGSTFPFQNGIVLSTGRLSNVEGPNNSLSDDDAPNWNGDNDLENILDESNTLNATIIEFNFTAIADQISFRYIFASEEYQEGDSSTCQYSDLFGFLIKPENTNQYQNIALVPNTQTPVKVTTVHPEIPNGCEAQNEQYFGSWNDNNAPINFNGQTAILTATADIVPNEVYHVKLVIADEFNYRYDSAVFLEAGSFQLSTDLGPDRLIATNNPLCQDETLTLDANQPVLSSYDWYKDGVLQTSTPNCFNCGYYTVSEPGTYSVEVTILDDCVAYGEVIIEYADDPLVFDSVLIDCDIDQDNFTVYNLWDAVQDITNNDDLLQVSGFFINENDANQNLNPIADPSYFENTSPNQTVYARVENSFSCYAIAELQLQAAYNNLYTNPFTTCDDDLVDGFTNFNLTNIQAEIATLVPQDASILFYETLEDVYLGNNLTGGNYTNNIPHNQTIFTQVMHNNQCYALAEIELVVLYTPVLEDDITSDNPIYYCLNNYPETITLYGGVLNDSPSNYYYSWNTGENMSFIEVNEPGTYTVTVTDPNGCSNSRSIVVTSSNIATIDNVIVEDLSVNNNITIEVSGEGNYEFALNNSNGPYQDSNYFENIPSGFHTVYVRDKIGCGIVEQIISVRGFPKYFTPNDDTYKDTWHVNGISSEFHLGTNVIIFNRYGKLISTLNNQTSGWNGTFNGEALPSDDYWFIVTFADGKEYRGHFALVR
ncbi:choice-of-anchor L domain-containing protein [Pontimicrobium sp. IMCC45349]|uniref:choice-of-anchor L domain-containing protein n=1 Tax=Pontimicrobium sp. IMCC45349 TaxID=3391574 RepID=UPI00399F0650